ncbi:hypothetical protein [Bradyrhizobium sp. AUGA SZCCT0042]|uniref:hypothetical protein n=1 Tax=Bradyrhizobium sp. AUGA SZCCT0042 TaxID=2807651 RepID=UPI001BAC7198|nr:hypothetical protein [Bradyrhizobium sp. AUGA SZCCT0042]MBR1302158.1 hypothetical protein [Bradyrhizobium sp. AUGA SZCCT0042]
MRRAITIAFSTTIILFGSANNCLSQDWFIGAENNCAGNTAAIAAFSALLPSSYPIRIGANTLYTSIDAPSVNLLLSGEKVVDNLALNKAAAADYRKAMETITDNYNVPFVVEVGGAILGGMAPPVVGLPGGLLFSYVVSKINARLAPLKSVVLFVAEGGQLQRRWKVVREADKATYAISSLEYVVSLGLEQRRFFTQGCLYPVNVVVSEFETNEKITNKIIKPNGGGGMWGVWDIDDNKWDSWILKYNYQDKEFYYFFEDAIENGTVKGQHEHRISFQGGRWQYKNFFDGAGAAFKNLSSPGIKVK